MAGKISDKNLLEYRNCYASLTLTSNYEDICKFY